MIPIAGSAYTYAYAILGEIVAWIIGWDLILEYAVSNMSVAVGFSAYLQDLFDNLFGFHLPPSLAYPPFPAPGGPAGCVQYSRAAHHDAGDVGAGARRARKRRSANTTMVLIKIGAILLFCLGAAGAIQPEQLASVSRRTDFRAFSPALPSSSSPTSVSIPSRPPPRSASKPAARSAVRHHRHADCLHHSLLRRFAGADRHREL